MSTRPSSSSRLKPAERARLRRVLRSAVLGLIGLEVLIIAMAAVPARAAYWVCTIPCLVNDSIVDSNTDSMLDKLIQDIIPNLVQANAKLSIIEANETKIFEIDRQHSRELDDDWDSDLAAVTETPTGKLQGISFAEANPGNALLAMVPGATPWTDYYDEYLSSADTTLLTLRTSLDALHEHNQRIEDASALDRITDLASDVGSSGTSGKGFLAMDELEVQSALEVARQLQALRAQYALKANIYAVAESHRVGSEARSNAEDKEAGCRSMTSAMAGVAGFIAGSIAC